MRCCVQRDPRLKPLQAQDNKSPAGEKDTHTHAHTHTHTHTQTDTNMEGDNYLKHKHTHTGHTHTPTHTTHPHTPSLCEQVWSAVVWGLGGCDIETVDKAQ